MGCKDVVFHFNKKHLEDPSVPMWILKTGGKSYYVEHVDCQSPWSTKETPDNSHTKGSIKVKNCLLVINDQNQATITPLTIEDQFRLRNQQLGITRVIVHENDGHAFRRYLKDLELKHGPIKGIGGACSSTFYITDILEQSHFTALGLALAGTTFRELMPNEGYYKIYDQGKDQPDDFLWEEHYEYEDDDDEEDIPRHNRRTTLSKDKGIFSSIWDTARAIRKRIIG